MDMIKLPEPHGPRHPLLGWDLNVGVREAGEVLGNPQATEFRLSLDALQKWEPRGYSRIGPEERIRETAEGEGWAVSIVENEMRLCRGRG